MRQTDRHRSQDKQSPSPDKCSFSDCAALLSPSCSGKLFVLLQNCCYLTSQAAFPPTPSEGNLRFPLQATPPSSPQGWCCRPPDLSSSPRLQLGTGLSTFRRRRHNGTDPHPAGRKGQSCCLCSGRSGSRIDVLSHRTLCLQIPW